MFKVKVIGIGAAGNKAAIEAYEKGIIKEDEMLLINSNPGDIPNDYKNYGIVFSATTMGTGKERNRARELAIDYLNGYGEYVDNFAAGADLIVVVNSTEGGTGSGGSAILYKYLLNVCDKPVMAFVFTGFEEDGRGLKNTIGYFADIDPRVTLQVISNRKFMPMLSRDKLAAERAANAEFVERLRIISGQDMVEGSQNIDRTDLLKLVTTPGFMQVEHIKLEPEPKTVAQCDQLIEAALPETKSLETTATCKRLGVIVNANESLRTTVDYSFEVLVNKYGTPYEVYTHVQQPGLRGGEIFIIAAGLDMPLVEVKSVYERMAEKASKVAKPDNSFAEALKGMADGNGEDAYDLRRNGQATEEEIAEKKREFSQQFSK